ncbi:MAG TPA: 30S ribosomal protein S20 [Firmicutes bacterium]|nr:30S ribosomal protein S20 [Bacillota bacterium]
MPNIKSAKKRVLVNQAKAARNKAVKSNLKTMVKKANVAMAASAPESAEAVKLAIKKIDQACAKGILHKNTAARKKSALAVKLNAIG